MHRVALAPFDYGFAIPLPIDAAMLDTIDAEVRSVSVENPAIGTGYAVQIPGGAPARCNPVSAPAACRAPGLKPQP